MDFKFPLNFYEIVFPSRVDFNNFCKHILRVTAGNYKVYMACQPKTFLEIRTLGYLRNARFERIDLW